MNSSTPDFEINVEALYRKYAPMVLRRCRSILRDEDAAQDAMQDVFVQLLRRYPQGVCKKERAA
jgi:DNA-directed RNA polymerase specialized sigma24 family protein